MKKRSAHATATPVQRIKLYKQNKLWVAALVASTMVTGIGFAGGVSVAQPVFATTTAPADDTTISVIVKFLYKNVEIPAFELTGTTAAANTKPQTAVDYNGMVATARQAGYEYLTGPILVPCESNDQQKVYTVTLTAQSIFVNHVATATEHGPFNQGDPSNYYNSIITSDKVDAAHLNSTREQTINYLSTSGKVIAPAAHQSIDIYRNAAPYNIATEEVTYTPWQTDDSASTPNPHIEGYQDVKEAATVLNTANGLETVNVIYTPITKTHKVYFVDDDAAQGTTIESTTAVASESFNIEHSVNYDVAAQIPAGYELATGQSASGTLTYTSPDAVYVHLVHKHTTVSADGPYTNGITASDLNRTNTQTIHYQYADGSQAAADKVQTATATRSAIVDEATGDITYTDWSDGSFSAVISPAIPGYKASEDTIAAVEDVTADVESTVFYTKNALPDTADNDSAGGKTNKETSSTSPVTGSKTTDNRTTTAKHRLPSTGNHYAAGVVATGIAAIIGILGLIDAKRRRG